MASGRTRGGRKRDMPNLKARQRLWDIQGETMKSKTKRPGSNKK